MKCLPRVKESLVLPLTNPVSSLLFSFSFTTNKTHNQLKSGICSSLTSLNKLHISPAYQTMIRTVLA